MERVKTMLEFHKLVFAPLAGTAVRADAPERRAVPLEWKGVQLRRMGQQLVLTAQGQGIAALQLEVFSLGGERIYDSGFVTGRTLRWVPQSQGEPLANGVYLYAVTVRGADGQTQRSEIRKLVVLR